MGLLARVLCIMFILSSIPTAASACLYLSEIYPSPSGTNNEWLEIYNNCNVSVKLTVITINDSTAFSKTLYGATNSTFIVVANRQELLESEFGLLDAMIVNLSYGRHWMDLDGDTIYLLNGSEIIDIVTYDKIEYLHSWSLCNGTWKETENATPGYENICPEEAETPPVNDTLDNETEENTMHEFDFSGISLDVYGPAEPARFGDFAQVKAVLHAGGNRVPLRIVAYIYTPHWVSVDLDGETIRSKLNETKTALDIETPEDGEDVILQLPLFVKDNCDGDYEDGIYTGKVRVYRQGTDETVAVENFNITLSGNNDIFCCEECDDCKCPEKKCTCASGSSQSAAKKDQPEIMELLEFSETVQAGVPFETKVRVENTETGRQTFSVYSYAYEGSRCISMGLKGPGWEKTWIANMQSFELGAGEFAEINLSNMFGDDISPDIYTFRVRLKYMEKTVDITRSIKVTPAPERLEENDNFTVEIITGENDVDEFPVTGMVTERESEGVSAPVNLYESFIAWLLSVFKF